MIIGLAVRVLFEFLRRRGVRVPDPSRLRLRQPRLGLMNRAVDVLVERTEDQLSRRKRRTTR